MTRLLALMPPSPPRLSPSPWWMVALTGLGAVAAVVAVFVWATRAERPVDDRGCRRTPRRVWDEFVDAHDPGRELRDLGEPR